MTGRSFLGVERSVTGRRWQPRLEDARLAEAISQRHDLPDILGRVLAARGVGLDAAEAFLNPTLRMLMPQPGALRDMEKGAERLAAGGIDGLNAPVRPRWPLDATAQPALGAGAKGAKA